MPNNNESDITEAKVNEAFAAEGYVLDRGGRDYAKMRDTAYRAIRTAKALSLQERDAAAVTRNGLITTVFPSLEVPVDTGPQAKVNAADEDELLAVLVWRDIDRMVWELTRPGFTGAFQKMITADLGNGYVICRYKAGVDKTDAVYVTDDIRCIERDFIGPRVIAAQRAIDRDVKDRTMLIMLRPDDQDRILRGFDQFTHRAVTGGHDRIVESIEASRPGYDDEPGDDNDGEAA